jgi:hypothetical protein
MIIYQSTILLSNGFADIGEIDDHYCLNFLFINTNTNKVSSLNFLFIIVIQIQVINNHESLNSNGHQFHQYQQNQQPPLLVFSQF